MDLQTSDLAPGGLDSFIQRIGSIAQLSFVPTGDHWQDHDCAVLISCILGRNNSPILLDLERLMNYQHFFILTFFTIYELMRLIFMIPWP